MEDDDWSLIEWHLPKLARGDVNLISKCEMRVQEANLQREH